MRARNVMTADVTSVTPTTPVRHAYLQMIELGVRHLPVVAHGRLQGIVSDRDLLRVARERKHRLELPALTVSEVMTRHPITAGPSATVAELAQQMVDERVDVVLITNSERALLGLVTSTDLLRLLTDLMQPSDVLPPTFNLRHAED